MRSTKSVLIRRRRFPYSVSPHSQTIIIDHTDSPVIFIAPDRIGLIESDRIGNLNQPDRSNLFTSPDRKSLIAVDRANSFTAKDRGSLTAADRTQIQTAPDKESLTEPDKPQTLIQPSVSRTFTTPSSSSRDFS